MQRSTLLLLLRKQDFMRQVLSSKKITSPCLLHKHGQDACQTGQFGSFSHPLDISSKGSSSILYITHRLKSQSRLLSVDISSHRG